MMVPMLTPRCAAAAAAAVIIRSEESDAERASKAALRCTAPLKVEDCTSPRTRDYHPLSVD